VPPIVTTTTGAERQRQPPPPPLASKPSPFPAIARSKLDNGLRIAVVEAHAIPIVQIRLVTFAGMGYGAPGAGEMTAQMLKDGGTRSLAFPAARS
jgi:hypothetical protein